MSKANQFGKRLETASDTGEAACMKIAFAHQYLGALGGAETDILLTATHLKERGHEVVLLFETATGRNEQTWRETFTECVQISGNAYGHLEQFSPDLIYLHSISTLAVLESLVNSGIPIVRRVHDHRMYCLRGYKYNYFTRNICRRPAGLHCVFPCGAVISRNPGSGFPLRWASYSAKRKEIQLNQRCARFITYSQYQKEELIRNGFVPDRIYIHVPIGCRGTTGPVSNFSDRNLVLFAGQIIRGKGVDLLLRALAKLRGRFECVILGDGNHRAHCERLCRKLGLDSKVRFLGFVPREQVQEYFLQASVLVLSSVWPEPFALVGQEALSYGLPVVGFDAGGIREWLLNGENGFLVPWMDTDAMAARIDDLLKDKALACRLGQRGRELVNEQYDAQRQIDALEGILWDVAEPRVSASKAAQSKASEPLPLSTYL